MTWLHWAWGHLPLLTGLGLASAAWLLARRTRLAGWERVDARRVLVIDGDTVWLMDASGEVAEKMRLESIQAPETHMARDAAELRAGLASKAALKALVGGTSELLVRRGRKERYGRTLVRIEAADGPRRDLGLRLADAGLARPWRR